MGVTFIRTIILLAVLVVSMRIMGKRQLGELEPLELVVAVLISNLASQPLQDIGIPLLYGLVPVLTLLSCQVLISGLSVQSPKFRRLLCGKPSMMISDGKIIENEMRKNRIALDELMVELRRNGIIDIQIVKHAVLETDGSLSIILYPSESPVTPRELNLQVEDVGIPVTIICDGHTLKENMRLLGFDEKWLKKQLDAHKVKTAKDVFLLSADNKGNVYFAKKEGTK